MTLPNGVSNLLDDEPKELSLIVIGRDGVGVALIAVSCSERSPLKDVEMASEEKHGQHHKTALAV